MADLFEPSRVLPQYNHAEDVRVLKEFLETGKGKRQSILEAAIRLGRADQELLHEVLHHPWTERGRQREVRGEVEKLLS